MNDLIYKVNFIDYFYLMLIIIIDLEIVIMFITSGKADGQLTNQIHSTSSTCIIKVGGS